ncbi:MAG: hypothetical protein AB7U79_03460 [Candidatus Izemoplasmatales bacterium]
MYKTLVKVLFKENFNFRRILQLGDQKSKSKAILLFVALTYALVAFLGAFGFLFFNLGSIFKTMDLTYLLLVYAFFYQIILILMFALFRSSGYIFQYKDYEILAPLPIPSKTVMAAKLTVMMVIMYVSNLLFTSPIFAAYFYYANFNLIGVISFVFIFLATPLLPTMLFSFVSLGIARITVRLRNAKVISTILMILVFLFVMYLSFSMNSSTTNPFLGQQAFLTSLKDVYPPVVWYIEAVQDGNILSLLGYVLINVIPFILYLYLIQGFIHKTNQKSLSIVTLKSSKPVKNTERSVQKTLISKEFKRYINSQGYAMNTGVGAIMALILGIGSLFFTSQIETYVNQFAVIGFPIEFILLAMLSFILSMIYTSAVSLSLEGKNLWIAKSLPIKAYDLMKSKMIFNIMIGLSATLISMICLSFSFQINFLWVVLMIAFLIGFSFFSSGIGSLINLYFPKFDFRNDLEVVKQSAAAIIALLGNMSFIALYAGIIYLLDKVITPEWILLVLVVLNFILFYIVIRVLKKIAQPMLYKMKA